MRGMRARRARGTQMSSTVRVYRRHPAPAPIIPPAHWKGWRVVALIRDAVARPAHLPSMRPFNKLRWKGKSRVQGSDTPDVMYCPMGLHPRSMFPSPCRSNGFAGGALGMYEGDDAVIAFFTWWDNLEADDATAAMDVIWDKKACPIPEWVPE